MTQFLPRGVLVLMQALAWCGSSGNILTFDCFGTHCWISEEGRIICVSEPLRKYTCRSKFIFAVICIMSSRRVFSHLSLLQRLKSNSTQQGEITSLIHCYWRCKFLHVDTKTATCNSYKPCNSLQPRMTSMFNSKWNVQINYGYVLAILWYVRQSLQMGHGILLII